LAGHSHRLTSGGKAEPDWPISFEAKLLNKPLFAATQLIN
jgi:hypothetical protein